MVQSGYLTLHEWTSGMIPTYEVPIIVRKIISVIIIGTVGNLYTYIKMQRAYYKVAQSYSYDYKYFPTE